MKKYLVILLTIVLVFSACTAKSQQSAGSLIGSWKLTSYGPVSAPTPAVADAEAGLTFKEDGTVTGNSGCNGFGGDYTVKGDRVTFDQIVSTLMACDDPRMAQEEAVHKVLTDTATFEVEGNTLTLTNNDLVLILTK
ncbi:MAG TPA: META domain-containing protein [Anaerolineales bacterium]|nr:META domain-containing protein [Anaerolineales bacterium]